MKKLPFLMGAILAFVSLSAVVGAQPWSENFDGYAVGSGIIGQGGWEGWDGNPAADAFVTDLVAYNPPNSLEVGPTSDVVQQFTGATSGFWVMSGWQYIPGGAVGGGWFILLNTYNSGGTKNWSLQLSFENGEVTSVGGQPGTTLPIIYDQWVLIEVQIDLDADLQSAYYGGQLVVTKSWTDGVTGGGATNIGAVDLWGGGGEPSSRPGVIYYDGFVFEGGPATPVEPKTWGSIKAHFR